MKTFFSMVCLLSMAQLFQGCGWVQSLRHDVEDEPDTHKKLSDFNYNSPENRYVPPPPASVQDNRAAVIAGTPVDFSGYRVKSGRVTKNDFVAEENKNENSLWAEDGQNNYLFARNKLKNPGDIVSVVIEDGLRKDMVGEVKKLLPPDMRDLEIKVPGLTKDQPAADDKTAQAQRATASADSASTEPGPNDILTAEVLERYPNGNVRLRGIKRVPFKRAVRNIEVTAIVKGVDISEQDVVKSSRFFEQRVELYR